MWSNLEMLCHILESTLVHRMYVSLNHSPLLADFGTFHTSHGRVQRGILGMKGERIIGIMYTMTI
jgi:hypothetical protein